MLHPGSLSLRSAANVNYTHTLCDILREGMNNMNVTWDDLLIPIETTDPARCLAPWSGVINSSCRPVAVSAFGDWFLQLPDESVRHLCMIEGTFEQVARDFSDFQIAMNTQSWQERYLLSQLCLTLKEQNKSRTGSQAFAFQIHPRLGGAAVSGNVVILDLFLWNSICAQVFGLGT